MKRMEIEESKQMHPSILTLTRRRRFSRYNSTVKQKLSMPQSVRDEFLAVALSTAVTTSMVTARMQKRTLRLQMAAFMYLPRPPQLYRLNAPSGVEAPHRSDQAPNLTQVYRQLEFAMAMTPLMCKPWLSKATDPTLWEGLSVLWTPLSGVMRALLLLIEESDSLIASERSTKVLELESLLNATRRGETPCILIDGHVIIPGYMDRRHERRVPVGVSVQIDFGYGPRRAVLKDISVSGAALTAAPTLPDGTAIWIGLPGGHRLVGTTVWSHDGSLGIRFSEKLQETSSLFARILNMANQARRGI